MGVISGLLSNACCEAICLASDIVPDLNTATRSSDRFAAPSFNVDLLSVDFGDLDVKYITRACDGYIVAVHVLNYLDGKEGFRGDWNCTPRMQKAANALSKALGFCIIYKNVSDDTSFEDLGVNSSGNPIITKRILSEVMEKYPLSEDTKKGSRFYDKESDSIVIEYETPKPEDIVVFEEVPFDDSSVEVMDVEEQVIKASKAKTEKEEKEKQKDLKSPIVDQKDQKFLNITNEVQELTEHQKKTFDELFGKYLHGKKYELHRMKAGSIECLITDEIGIYSRWIDPGLVVGDGWNVLGNVFVGLQGFGEAHNVVDTIPVNYRDEDICEHVFQNGNYMLTQEEVARCNSRLFQNQMIYSIFDMSTMNARIEKMTPEEFSKFGETLTKVIGSLKPEELGRFRFYDWKGISRFKLISDQKCMSPFPGPTRYNITGVEVTVDGDKITIKGSTEKSSSLKETAA